MRVEIYEDLLAINEATEQTMKRIEKLRDAGHLTPEFAVIHLLVAEQNCAEINTSIAHDLAGLELEDATRLQRECFEKQKELAETDAIKGITMEKGQEHEATTTPPDTGTDTGRKNEQCIEDSPESPKGSDTES